MTRRAVILSLFGVALLASVAYFNDHVIKNSYLTNNFLPVATYGALFLFATLINPLLARMQSRWTLTARELAIVIATALIAGFAVGRGFLHHFTASLLLPQRLERTRPDWHGEVPRLRAEDIRDAAGLSTAFRDAAVRPPGDPARAIADRAPPDTGARDAAEWARVLNAVIADRTLRTAVREDALPGDLTAHVRNLLARDPADLTDEQSAALNRSLKRMLSRPKFCW